MRSIVLSIFLLSYIYSKDYTNSEVYCNRAFLEQCGLTNRIFTKKGDIRVSGYLNFKVGNTVYSMHLKKGLVHGEYQVFVGSVLKRRTYYFMGRLHGSDSSFYNDGSIKSQDIYIQGFKISGYLYNKRGYKKEYNLKEINKYNKKASKLLI